MLVLFAAAALALSGPTGPENSARYALELSVVRGGVTTVSTRSVVVEDGHAMISIVDSERAFEMTAALNTVQGHGNSEQLALSLSVTDGDAEAVEPNLIFDRGETARVQIGDEDPTGRMVEGFTLNITPVPAPAQPTR